MVDRLKKLEGTEERTHEQEDRRIESTTKRTTKRKNTEKKTHNSDSGACGTITKYLTFGSLESRKGRRKRVVLKNYSK